jgi:hypothetical protein
MAEQLFIQYLHSAQAETIQIRLNSGRPIARVCRISLKPVYRPEHDSRLALGAGAKRIFISSLERRAT